MLEKAVYRVIAKYWRAWQSETQKYWNVFERVLPPAPLFSSSSCDAFRHKACAGQRIRVRVEKATSDFIDSLGGKCGLTWHEMQRFGQAKRCQIVSVYFISYFA